MDVRRQPGSLADAVTALEPWFHNLHLPDGTQTAPDHFLGDFPAYKWEELGRELPRDLSGWRALDIGCNAGFYSFELARRGASVTAVDMNPHYLRQAQWAAEQYGLADAIRFRRMQVYDLAHETADYDLVLFLGVFYHLRYPLLGLDAAARLARRLFCFQSLSMPGEESAATEPDLPIDERERMRQAGWPTMAFIEHALAGDPTNWWAPNHACIEALLRSTGMQVIARPGKETYVCRPDPEARARALARDGLEFDAASGRARH